MQLNERWLWLGDTVSPADAGVTIFQAYRGSWWLGYGPEMLGPFDDRAILRAVRIACTPTIDGCELGPSRNGVAELSPRHLCQRGPRWQETSERDLPASVTVYDRRGLEPVSGCCTIFEAMPKVSWGTTDRWAEFLEHQPTRGGWLADEWNAHPTGSLLFTSESTLEAGFAIVDLPG